MNDIILELEPRSRPILFSDEMVRAILSGDKTQTRRVIKDQARFDSYEEHFLDKGCFSITMSGYDGGGGEQTTREMFAERFCPFGTVGDLLWVRECFTKVPRTCLWPHLPHAISPDGEYNIYYRSGFDRCGVSGWRPSIHMPRWASRITLKITDVRVERLQDISEEDARAEGITLVGASFVNDNGTTTPYSHRNHFEALWESIHGEDSWSKNPWVWVVKFERLEK